MWYKINPYVKLFHHNDALICWLDSKETISKKIDIRNIHIYEINLWTSLQKNDPV